MGSMLGHIFPGIGFLIIGLWHLFNHIKLYTLRPSCYAGHLWFPLSSNKFRYFEPVLIIVGSTASIAIELFISPHRHQPLDPDLTIPSNHLHTFEHASISLALLIYASFLVLLDRASPKITVPRGLTHLLASMALAQELVVFHLHSTDHAGPEGQYHFFLQLLVLVSLTTTLMGIGFPKSFMVSFLRSISIFFQGVWFIVMGFMLWTPGLLPKGCFLHNEDGRKVAKCSGEESLHRAKSLINLEFSWFLTGISTFGVLYFLFLAKIYGGKAEYFSLARNEEKNDTTEPKEKKSIS